MLCVRFLTLVDCDIETLCQSEKKFKQLSA